MARAERKGLGTEAAVLRNAILLIATKAYLSSGRQHFYLKSAAELLSAACICSRIHTCDFTQLRARASAARWLRTRHPQHHHHRLYG